MPRKKTTAQPTEPSTAQPLVASDIEPTAALVSSYVAFGIPRAGRMPVGARFASHEVEAARWIARHFGLELLEATSSPALALAAQLRGFELRANGSPILPVIAQTLWENLRALAATQVASIAPNDDGMAGQGDGAQSADTDRRSELVEALRAAIAPGDVVLTPEYDRRGCIEGWWEAAVLSIPNNEGEACTVCWLDEPEAGFRRRRREELIPLYPARPESTPDQGC